MRRLCKVPCQGDCLIWQPLPWVLLSLWQSCWIFLSRTLLFITQTYWNHRSLHASSSHNWAFWKANLECHGVDDVVFQDLTMPVSKELRTALKASNDCFFRSVPSKPDVAWCWYLRSPSSSPGSKGQSCVIKQLCRVFFVRQTYSLHWNAVASTWWG